MVLGLLIPPLIVCHQVKQYLRMKYVYKSMNFFDFLQPMENEKEVQDASQRGRSGQSPGGLAKVWGQDRGAEALFAHEQSQEMDTWEIGGDHHFGCSGSEDYHYGYSDPKDRSNQDLEGSKQNRGPIYHYYEDNCCFGGRRKIEHLSLKTLLS